MLNKIIMLIIEEVYIHIILLYDYSQNDIFNFLLLYAINLLTNKL